MPAADRSSLEALEDKLTIGEIRNLGLDDVVELCGVLPPRSDNGQPTVKQVATNGPAGS